ncbi:MAG: O-antigen ligase family protein [Cyanobacteria bacterium J06623_7]
MRTAWYAWIIGMVALLFSLQERHQIRIITAFSLLLLLLIPLATVDPFAEIISSRFSTFTNLETDGSFLSRMGQLEQGLEYALSEVMGWGLMAPGQAPEATSPFSQRAGLFSVVDNGYLTIMVSFGWFATIVYVTGIVLLVAKFYQAKNLDLFAIASRAIVVASIARIMTSDIASEQYAMPVWGFLGVGLAACKYYQNEHRVRQKERLNPSESA